MMGLHQFGISHLAWEASTLGNLEVTTAYFSADNPGNGAP